MLKHYGKTSKVEVAPSSYKEEPVLASTKTTTLNRDSAGNDEDGDKGVVYDVIPELNVLKMKNAGKEVAGKVQIELTDNPAYQNLAV